MTPTEIAKAVGVTSSTVSHHLFNMEREEIVERDPEDVSRWKMGPWTQAELTSFLSKRKSSKKGKSEKASRRKGK